MSEIILNEFAKMRNNNGKFAYFQIWLKQNAKKNKKAMKKSLEISCLKQKY